MCGGCLALRWFYFHANNAGVVYIDSLTRHGAKEIERERERERKRYISENISHVSESDDSTSGIHYIKYKESFRQFARIFPATERNEERER